MRIGPRPGVMPLRLDLSSAPAGTDIGRTIAMHDRVASERFADMARAESLTGFSLDVVEHVGKRPAAQKWYQLKIVGRAGKHVLQPGSARTTFETVWTLSTHV